MLKINEEHQKNILLVDDDNSVTKMLKILLESRGYRVDVACSGQEALSKVSTSTDIILLDLILPDQGGFDVCRKIRQLEPACNVPIIMLSGKLLSEDIVEGLQLGADDYLTKPFEYEELIARIEAIIRRRDASDGSGVSDKADKAVITEIRRIIETEAITPFFQPIYKFQPFELLGFEALCRPHTQSMLSNPEVLFKAAMEFGYYYELEMLSWKKAIEHAKEFLKDKKLFLNCNPYLVEGHKFLTIKSLFTDGHIRLENVVLEITERSKVNDFKSFYENLRMYKECGFQFAIDDVGGGYASLESIVETKPEVVKIDQHIVRDVHKDSYKRSIVKFIVAFCKESNILSIAEGIETKEDLRAVQELNVDAGQGYHLYKPTPEVNLQEAENVIDLTS